MTGAFGRPEKLCDRSEPRPLPHHCGARRRGDGGGVASHRLQAWAGGGARPCDQALSRKTSQGEVPVGTRFRFRSRESGDRLGRPVRDRRAPMRVSLVDVADGGRHPWRDLAPRDTAGVFSIDYLAVNPGGEGYVYSYRRLLSTLQVIEGLQ